MSSPLNELKEAFQLGINLSFGFEVVDLQNPCEEFCIGRYAMASFTRMNFHTASLGRCKILSQTLLNLKAHDPKLRLLRR